MKKLLDEQGRIFGLINLIDLIVIIILLGLGIKIFSDYRPAPLDFKDRQITVGLLCRNIPPYLAESLAVGQDLFRDGTNTYIGKIYAIRTQPAQLLLIYRGMVNLTQSPRNLDLYLTVRNRGRLVTGPAKTGVFLGKLAVRVGDKLRLHTLYSSLMGEIEYIRTTKNVR